MRFSSSDHVNFRQRHHSAVLVAVFALCYGATHLPAFAMQTEMEKKWSKSFREGTEALDTNRYWIAEPQLRLAVLQAEHFGSADIRLARSLGELGRLLTIRGRFSEAEPYLERELHVKEYALGTGNGETFASTGALIRFYLEYGTKDKADPMTEDLLDFLDGKMREPLEQGRGKVVVKKGQTIEAWAGTAAPAMRDPLLEWSITCDMLGNVYRAHKRYVLADRLFKAALDIKATVLGKNHLSLANSYDSLGMLCMEKKEYKEAEGYFRDALRTTEGVLAPQSPEVYNRLDKLAKCLIKEGKFSEAEQLYFRAQTFWTKAPSKGGDEARAMYSLGCLYTDWKRYDAATNAFSRGLRMSERFNGTSSIALVPYLRMLGYVCYYSGRRGDCDHYRGLANAICGDFEVSASELEKRQEAIAAKKQVANKDKPTKSLADVIIALNKKNGVTDETAVPAVPHLVGLDSFSVPTDAATSTTTQVSETATQPSAHSAGETAVATNAGAPTSSGASATSPGSGGVARTPADGAEAAARSVAFASSKPAVAATPAGHSVATTTAGNSVATTTAGNSAATTTAGNSVATTTAASSSGDIARVSTKTESISVGAPLPGSTTNLSAAPGPVLTITLPVADPGVLLAEREKLLEVLGQLQARGVNVGPYMPRYLAIEQKVRENVPEAQIAADIARLTSAANDQFRVLKKYRSTPTATPSVTVTTPTRNTSASTP